jgi:hypothetical protein
MTPNPCGPGIPSLPMEIEFGNAGEVETNGTGWFIGFSPWSKTEASALRHMPADLEATGLCVKWVRILNRTGTSGFARLQSSLM